MDVLYAARTSAWVDKGEGEGRAGVLETDAALFGLIEGEGRVGVWGFCIKFIHVSFVFLYSIVYIYMLVSNINYWVGYYWCYLMLMGR